MATWQLDPETTHLNHGSFGASPVEVLDRQRELRHEMEANPVTFMMRSYQPLLEESRTAIADFVGANPDGLVFVPNATYGVNSVLRSVGPLLGAGSEIVITSHTYNACRNAAVATAARIDATVVTAAIPFPISSPDEATQAVLAAVSDRTRLVIIDHVTSATGLVLPVAQIIDALPEGVLVLVDGAHAPGMIDLDLRTLGADFYTANCHKWMCSPKGAAFLYVAEPHRAKMSAAVISHGYNDGWPASGSRFHAQFDWTGTDDPTARLCVARAIEVMGEHRADGWSGVRASNRALALQGRTIVAEALQCALPAPDSMIGSIASLPVPPLAVDPSELFDPLNDRLHTQWRIEVPVLTWPESPQRLLRISAQQYNRIADYERLAHALAQEQREP
jgi:isopenicillin-N epimerase